MSMDGLFCLATQRCYSSGAHRSSPLPAAHVKKDSDARWSSADPEICRHAGPQASPAPRTAGSGDGAGVVLLGEYAAAAAHGDADSAPPADSAVGPQAMDVDAAPGASPSTGADGGAVPGSPGGQLAAEEVSGLPPELARSPPGECDPKLRVRAT